MEASSKEKSFVVSGPDYEIPDPLGFGHMLFRMMCMNRNVIAQIDSETRQSETYGSLLRRSIRTAIHIIWKDITKDDVICHCSGEHFDSCVPIISSLLIGVKIACLDPTFTLNETKNLLKKLRPKAIFVDLYNLALIEEALDELDIQSNIICFGQSVFYDEFESYLEPTNPVECEVYFEPISVDDLKQTAIILFNKKQRRVHKICVNHLTAMLQLTNSIRCWSLGKDALAVSLNFTEYNHVANMHMLLANILSGATRIIAAHFDPEHVWRLLDKYQISFMKCTTLNATQLYRELQPEGSEGKSLRLLVTSGTSFTKTDLLKLREIFPRCFITNSYEQAQVFGAISSYSLNKPLQIRQQYEHPTSCGKVMPGITCKIVDPVTESILGANKPGELRYKATFLNDNLDLEYHLDKSGWIKTEDIAFYDESRCIHFLDPHEDVFKYRSLHIIPSTIENVLKLHPAVKFAAVVNMGQPMAVVKLNKHMSEKVTAKDIEDYANGLLSDKQKLKGGLKIIKQFPLTPVGLPDRQKVRKMMLDATC